jgi:hypothetical protein
MPLLKPLKMSKHVSRLTKRIVNLDDIIVSLGSTGGVNIIYII